MSLDVSDQPLVVAPTESEQNLLIVSLSVILIGEHVPQKNVSSPVS